MASSLLSSALLLLLLALGWSMPQAPPAAAPPDERTVFDEIADPAERREFRRVWDARPPGLQRDLAAAFVDRFPRSIVLREAYEIAAHASVDAGDAAAGLEWAKRSLRLLPENVSLLAMAAALAAAERNPVFADQSARSALRLLDTAAPPPAVSDAQWRRLSGQWRSTAHTVLGRLAADRQDFIAAEASLLEALRSNSDDDEALFLLGVVRVAAGRPLDGAPPLAEVLRRGTPRAAAATTLLRGIHTRGPTPPDLSFEAYAGALRWEGPQPPTAMPVAARDLRYAGSDACRVCHPREHARWQTTGMAKMLRAYAPQNVIGDFSSGQVVEGRARPVLDGGRHFIEVRDATGTGWTRHAVDYTIGSKWQQAYATRLPDRRLQVFPIQYRRRDSTWLNYWRAVDVPGSPRADIARFHEVPEDAVYQRTCAPCHTSQLAFPAGAEAPAAASFHEGGINCEMCHGPSRAHADRPTEIHDPGRRGIDAPVQFARITPAQSVAICAQCHAQSAIHDAAPGGAVNFARSGSWYRTYPTHLISSFPRHALYRDGRFRATTFISEAFARTQCFQRGGATCASCHDPHPPDGAANPTSLKFDQDDDRMCLQCHDRFREAPERHTRHAAGSAAGRCVACHMPRTADALLFKARSHQIDEIPDAAMTARFGPEDSPNACATCHADRGLDWLAAAMAVRVPK